MSSPLQALEKILKMVESHCGALLTVFIGLLSIGLIVTRDGMILLGMILLVCMNVALYAIKVIHQNPNFDKSNINYSDISDRPITLKNDNDDDLQYVEPDPDDEKFQKDTDIFKALVDEKYSNADHTLKRGMKNDIHRKESDRTKGVG